jgi:2,3-bisphosphoglycerate-independent phosphoglycerate mutase
VVKGGLSALKLIYIVIDGMGDLPIKELDNLTPLEYAPTPNMDSLAENGKTGLMYTVQKGFAPESDVAVISLLGYDPFKFSPGRGIIEVVGAGLNVEDGDLALRCNFATLGQGKEILDRRVGRTLTTQEAQDLSEEANKQVKLRSSEASFHFKNTLGHRAVLLIKNQDHSLSSKISNSDPAYKIVKGLGVAQTNIEMKLKKCKPLEETKAAKTSADLVNEFIEKTHEIWENHPININRTKEGKLKANVVLTRDAGHLLPNFFNINKRYNVNFAALVDMHAEKGIAQLTGMSATLLPVPSGDLEHDCEIRVNILLETLPKYDCVYIHLKGPDEPAHDGDCHEKTKIISAIDKYFVGPLLNEISVDKHVICITSDHATPCSLKVHSDTPVPVLISGGKVKGSKKEQKFSERFCKNGSLGVINSGYHLLPILIKYLKK